MRRSPTLNSTDLVIAGAPRHLFAPIATATPKFAEISTMLMVRKVCLLLFHFQLMLIRSIAEESLPELYQVGPELYFRLLGRYLSRV